MKVLSLILLGCVITAGCKGPSTGIDYRDWHNLTYFDKPSVSGEWVAWGGRKSRVWASEEVSPIYLYNNSTSRLRMLPISGVSVSLSETTIAYSNFENIFISSLADLSKKKLLMDGPLLVFFHLKLSYPILTYTFYTLFQGSAAYSFTTSSVIGGFNFKGIPFTETELWEFPPLITTDGNLVVGSDAESLKFFDSYNEMQIMTPTTIINTLTASPDISGTTIVWTDYRLGWPNGRIYAYDLTTTTISRISPVESRQQDPAIDGDKIVWTDFRNGDNNPDIYMYDLTTRAETQVTTDTHAQVHASISWDYIVWLDNRHGTKSVYLYQISTGTEREIWRLSLFP